jgi:hypothetical protein
MSANPSPRLRPFAVSLRQALSILLLAAIAGVAGGALSSRQAVRLHTSSVTVFVGEAFSNRADSFSLAPLLADFQTTLSLRETMRPVAEKFSIPTETLQFNLLTEREGQGSSVKVTYTAETSARAYEVAEEASLTALRIMAQRNLTSLDERTISLGEAIADLDEQLDKLLQQARVTDIETYFAELNGALVRSRIGESNASESETQATVDSELRRLRPLLREQRRIEEQRALLSQLLATALLDSERSESTLRAFETADPVVRIDTAPVSVLPSILRGAVSAGLLVLLLGMVWIAFSIRRNARRGAREATST